MNALIVDDEEFARENLKMLLEEFCPDVLVTGTAASARDARHQVEDFNPDLVFLDIMMPGEDGFSFLHSLDDKHFMVIFTTAFREHALKAIKEQAVDYLEKPVDIEELQKAVAKAKQQFEQKHLKKIPDEKLTRILESIALTNTVEKTVVPTKDGFAVLKNSDIIHLEAEENYTTFFVVGGKKYVVGKTIKAFEEKLDPNMFFRAHKSHIINITHHLKEFIRNEGNIAVMSNGTQIPVARRKVQELVDRLLNV